jgi:hypothetical protein
VSGVDRNRRRASWGSKGEVYGMKGGTGKAETPADEWMRESRAMGGGELRDGSEGPGEVRLQ